MPYLVIAIKIILLWIIMAKENKQNDSREDFIKIISHQLKAPVHAIQAVLKTITDGFTGEINPKALFLLGKALNRAGEIDELISDLMAYEFYSQDQAPLKEEFNLTGLFNSLVTKYASIASDNKISLHSDYPPNTGIYILGDSKGMEQAIRNILENAVKYTPAQGTVTARLNFSEADRKCRIRITDTGYGIPEEELTRIFEPFYRSLKHKANISGTGLGLAIAKKVINNLGGEIHLESKVNKGATFSIELPYTRLRKSKDRAIKKKKVLIIGGVTAGPKAAARLRRLDENFDITIVEQSEFLSYAGCGLPYYISSKVRSAQELMSTADNTIRDVHFFESIKNITALKKTRALEIDREKKIVKVQDLAGKSISMLSYDTLVLATGAVPLVPKIPGIKQKGIYSLHSLENAEVIKKELANKNAQDVYIIGGGLVGISTAESLIETGARVTILEKKAYILLNLLDRDIALKIQNELNKKGIKIITHTAIREINKSGNRLKILTEKETYQVDLIIVSAGVKPNIDLARNAGLEIGEWGGINVNEYLRTSDENIYAVGDCAESINLITRKHEYWPLGSVSTKMGRIAADNIAGRKSEFKGSIGTAMFKIFDLNVARTGLTQRAAWKNGIEAETATVTGLDKAHYYENSQYLVLKVIADAKTKIILGAQGYGKGDIVARIELLSCAITQSLTLEDVFKLDLGYAPAFNNPIDIAQTACLVLNNKLDNLFKTITLRDFEKEKDEAAAIIDVSPLSEYSLNSIPGSLNVPLENIRLESIPFDKKARIILYSKTSSGAYEAYRYLASEGYTNLYVLEGGYLYWQK